MESPGPFPGDFLFPGVSLRSCSARRTLFARCSRLRSAWCESPQGPRRLPAGHTPTGGNSAPRLLTGCGRRGFWGLRRLSVGRADDPTGGGTRPDAATARRRRAEGGARARRRRADTADDRAVAGWAVARPAGAGGAGGAGSRSRYSANYCATPPDLRKRLPAARRSRFSLARLLRLCFADDF
jgi:hypothetical protein